MSQMTDGAVKSFPNTAALLCNRRVVMSAGVLAYASALQVELGILEDTQFATTNSVNAPVRLRTAQGTAKMVASEAISQFAPVYAAANGKVAASGTILLGYALEAASADLDVVEVLRGTTASSPIAGIASGYKIARGQQTTVTATDTIVTGLATVVAVVACMDDNPGDNPFMVSATIGDQAGTPAAGSFILKTWQNTSGSDPTPAAASTFSKKVNWIAIGT